MDINNGNNVVLYANKNGTTEIIFTNEVGETVTYDVTVSGSDHNIEMQLKK